MPYSPQTWTNGSSKLNATRMTHIEDGISAAIEAPSSPSTNDGLFYNGTSWVADTIDNAKVDAAAAIAYSKLNLTGSIVNADISASAAIALSKLASTAWSTFTPTVTGSTTSPTAGTGATVDGRYMQIGKTVIGWARFVAGTSGFVNGSGDIRLGLPVAPRTTEGPVCGAGWVFDSSASSMTTATVSVDGNAYAVFRLDGTSRASWTSPFTFAASDQALMNFSYEAS